MSLIRPQTPPMGWNSWDSYGASVTEAEVLANAEYMARFLQPHGWQYVVVDIQWYEPAADGSRYHAFADLVMDEWGRLLPAANRFPSAAGGQGFLPLASAVHRLGLKFGIHILRGIPRQAVHHNTPIFGSPGVTARDVARFHSICPWNSDMYGVDPQHPGAKAYYDSLFHLYAEWGVDFVKVDDIAWSRLYGYHAGEVELIHQAIEHSGRDMVLSLSPGPSALSEVRHLQDHATMWRVSDDFWDQWSQLREAFDFAAQWAPTSRAGAYADLDMLPLGHLAIRSSETGQGDRWTRFTPEEQQTMMSLWAISRSPLMMGGDLPQNDADTLSLLTNKDILRLHQESYGGREVYRDESGSVWRARHEDGKSSYVAFFNWADDPRTMDFSWALTLEPGHVAYDLWSHQPLTKTEAMSIKVLAHGSRVFLVSQALPAR